MCAAHEIIKSYSACVLVFLMNLWREALCSNQQ